MTQAKVYMSNYNCARGYDTYSLSIPKLRPRAVLFPVLLHRHSQSRGCMKTQKICLDVWTDASYSPLEDPSSLIPRPTPVHWMFLTWRMWLGVKSSYLVLYWSLYTTSRDQGMLEGLLTLTASSGDNVSIRRGCEGARQLQWEWTPAKTPHPITYLEISLSWRYSVIMTSATHRAEIFLNCAWIFLPMLGLLRFVTVHWSWS